MTLDQKKAESSVPQLKLPPNQYVFSRQKELMLDLIDPRAGERVLCLGDINAAYLQLFREQRCPVTGFVLSAHKLEDIRKQTEPEIELHAGDAEDLPFSDDEFDIVAIINALEIARNPQKIIAEAIRVCRGRIFIGFLNKHSFAGTQQHLKEVFGFPLAEKVRFFGIEEIKKLVGSLNERQSFRWGSVIYFPPVVYGISTELEELIPYMKNPLGAFVGLNFPVKYVYLTAQSPVTASYPLKAKRRVTAPEAIRGI